MKFALTESQTSRDMSQNRIRLEFICLGHITALTSRCESCKRDVYNKNCKHYHPISVFETEIIPRSARTGLQRYLAKKAHAERLGYIWKDPSKKFI